MIHRFTHSIANGLFLRAGIAAATLCIAISSVTSAAQAQVTDSTRKDSLARAAQLHAVTITAAPADQGSPSTSTHVSQRVIELTPAATPWELLRQTAGVEVHQQGQGPGFASDASIRGFSSDHSTDLALWVDGVPINEPVNGHAEGYNDWSLLFPLAIQDIDIIKGPVSPLFGNFAISGVVNVRTIERMTGTQLAASGGSNGLADATALTGFDHGSSGGVFGLRARHEDGFRPNSASDLTQAHARIVRSLAPNVTVDGGIELYGARWRSPGYLSESEFAAHQYDIVSNPTDGGCKRRAQERVSLRVTSGDLIWRTTAYATQGRWQLFLTIPPAGGKFEGTGSQTEEEDSRTGFGLTSAVTYTTANTDLTVGTEGRLDDARYQNYFTTARARDSVNALFTGRQLSGALFVASSTTIGRLRLDLGGRYDILDTRSTPDLAGGETTSGAHGVFSPKMGALVRLTREVALYANASRGFRSTDGVLADPTLAPITVWAYESGVKLDVNHITASAALFRMDVSNEQTFNPLTAGSISGGASKRQGIELGLHAPVNSFATLSGNWTFNDARYTNQVVPGDDPNGPAVVLNGLRVYNTARYVGSTALDVSPSASADAPWTIRVSGNWVGPYSPFDEPGVVLGAYGLLHATASVRLNRAATLDIGARNVFDRAYPELVAGHIVAPGEPRTGYVAVRYRVL